MKEVEKMSVMELFDELSVGLYYGYAFRCVLYYKPRARKALEVLLSECKQDAFLREKMDLDNRRKCDEQDEMRGA